MTMLDLQQFCSPDETRWYLTKPFSKGDYSFATNGHLIVRQPRRADVPEIDAKAPNFNPNAPMEDIEKAEFFQPKFALPPSSGEKGQCTRCEGRGYKHDCPDCECECEGCNATGIADAEHFISTSVRSAIFALDYVRQIASLPGVQIAVSADLAKPMLFKFDGGDGALMPRSARFEKHIEIEKEPA